MTLIDFDNQNKEWHMPHKERITTMNNEEESNPSIYRIFWLALITLIIMLVVLVLVFHKQLFPSPKNYTKTYQAVSLTTGQVLFGEFTYNTEHSTLKNAFFIQTVGTSTSTTLVPLSQAVYGPEDTMEISNSQILHWENLSASSSVVTVIKGR